MRKGEGCGQRIAGHRFQEICPGERDAAPGQLGPEDGAAFPLEIHLDGEIGRGRGEGEVWTAPPGH